MENFDDARNRMVERQLRARGIRDTRVLEAMRAVPRHRFVPDALAEFAYSDTPLPIGEEQTISQPAVVARMIEAAEIKPGDRVLDVGTGSGYAAAVLAQLAAHVDSVERHRSLADRARAVLAEQGYDNVDVYHADGTLGLPERAPFDAIIAAAGGPRVPQSWLDQLAPGGRIVMPIGRGREHQRLIKLTRKSETWFDEEHLGDVVFVPLIGKEGWFSDSA